MRNAINRDDFQDREAGPIMPFKKEESEMPLRRENDNLVLAPPQELPGEMGKAVILPTNLTGKHKII